LNRLKKLRSTFWIIPTAGLLCLLLGIGFARWVHAVYKPGIYNSVSALPATDEPRVAIVFGAGVWRGNRPSPVLYDRIATAVELYKAGKAQKLLMTGDNRFANYNEPAVMRETALEMGVPDNDIVLDYAGRRTYDSCYRAKEIFGVRRAVLVTQAFHIDRAMYLCHSVGIDCVGVVADHQDYSDHSRFWWSTREVGATFVAWLDIHLLHPTPVLGDKIPIVF
jgi:SanA protein